MLAPLLVALALVAPGDHTLIRPSFGKMIRTSGAAAASTTFLITSAGAQTDYTMGTIRIHKSAGANSFGGANWTTQHVYAGTNIDDRFASVVFEVGGVAISHRRFNVRSGTSADFLIKIPTIPASGTVTVTVRWASSGVTTSTDATVTGWAVDGWERYNGTGLVLPYTGLESTLIYEGGKLRLWHSRPTGVNLWDKIDVHYRESTDFGQTWSAGALCVADHGRSFVRKGPDGKYHLIGFSWPTNTNRVDYYRSDTGDPGTWSLITADVLGPPAYGTQWGNVSFYHDGANWQLAAEHMNASLRWVIGLWSGPSLSSLTVSQDPIIPLASVGDLWPVALAGKRQEFGHSVYDGSGVTPTQFDRWDADTLTGTWTKREWWLKTQPLFGMVTGTTPGGGGDGGTPTPDTWDAAKPTDGDSQLGDLSMVEVGGRTLMAYEDIWHEAVEKPSLAMAVWDAPLARILDPAITHAKGDDLTAEGWVSAGANGEEQFPNYTFRKLTRNGIRTDSSAVSPVSIEAAIQDNVRGSYYKRALNITYDELDVHALIRAEQNTAYTEVRTMAGANVKAYVSLGTGGTLTWYTTGGAVGGTMAYTAGRYYDIRILTRTTGWDLWIDGVLKATGLGWVQGAWERPTHTFFGVSGGAAAPAKGYLNALWWSKAAAAGTEPTWGP